MNIHTWLQTKYLPISLIALMILTRFEHFGGALHLPDASLAVFFFAGFYRKKALLVFLLALAALIDAVAIQNGTSSYCISPAYVFLIPTYCVMYLAGYYCAKFKSLSLNSLGLQLSTVFLAASVAFGISNYSFYLLAGRFDDLSLSQYAERIAQFYTPYVGTVLLYATFIYAVMLLVKIIPALKSNQKSA
jgi:hypothetical protein